MAVNGFAAAQDIVDINTSVSALALIMGQRVHTNEQAIAVYAANLSTLETEVSTLSNLVDANALYTAAGTGAETRTANTKLSDMLSAKDFGAAGTGLVNDSAKLQKAIDAAYAAGAGTVYIPNGVYLLNDPLRLKGGVSLFGESRYGVKLYKPGNGTLTVAYAGSSALAQTIYHDAGGMLPTAANAILILDGVDRQYFGSIRNLQLQGDYTGSHVTPMVEFGILSIRGCSDATINDVDITHCKYGILIPEMWMSEISHTRVTYAHYGYGIGSGTSIFYKHNYANNCWQRGHHLRGLKYSTIQANGTDYLNYPAHWADRTKRAIAYDISSCYTVVAFANGQENTYGTSWYFDGFDHSIFTNNVAINVGSDQPNGFHTAVIYSTNIMMGSTITNNLAIGIKPEGLTFGAGDPAVHHDIYFEGLNFVSEVTLSGNHVRASQAFPIAEAGWGNNSALPPQNNIKDLSAMGTVVPASDYLRIYDASDGGDKKLTVDALSSAIPTRAGEVKAQAVFDMITPAVVANTGFASITRTGTGIVDFVFTTPRPDANYHISTGFQRDSGSSGGEAMNIEEENVTAAGFTLNCNYYTGAAYNFHRLRVAVF